MLQTNMGQKQSFAHDEDRCSSERIKVHKDKPFFLLHGGADLHIKDNEGITALIHAAYHHTQRPP